MINYKLALKQNLNDDDIQKIELLHLVRQQVHKALFDGALNPTNAVGMMLQSLDSDLQTLWRFEKNDRFYKWWWVPTCTCPKIDNDDAYPCGYYTTNMSCPLHGEAAKVGEIYEHGEYLK